MVRVAAEALNESASGPEHAAAVKRVLDQAVKAFYGVLDGSDAPITLCATLTIGRSRRATVL